MPADLDGDGDRDLVAARQDASLVEVVPNLGGGQFGRVCGSLVETAAPLTLLTAADLDGDGDLDLLTGVYTFEVGGDLRGEVAWYRNLGDWTFAPPHVLDGRPGITGLLAIDVDRDGDPDLVSASETHDGFTSTEDGLEWRGNLGQGRFGKPRRRTDLPVRALAVGDVLGNRLPELTIATWIDDLRWFGWTRIAARGALFRHPMTGGPGVSTRRPLPPERLPRSEYRA